jgi:hypothetical protein
MRRALISVWVVFEYDIMAAISEDPVSSRIMRAVVCPAVFNWPRNLRLIAKELIRRSAFLNTVIHAGGIEANQSALWWGAGVSTKPS